MLLHNLTRHEAIFHRDGLPEAKMTPQDKVDYKEFYAEMDMDAQEAKLKTMK
jgi:hypothetical protein